MSKSMPTVAVVGRTNVGKSTLFNRLTSDARSITFDVKGVTRDSIKGAVAWRGRYMQFVDTGGVTLRKLHDPLDEKMRACALAALKSADVVLFMCDGTVGVLPEDREIASMLLKMKRPTMVLVNKIDSDTAVENSHEFDRLGFKDIITISASHGTGMGDLLDEVVEKLPEQVGEAPSEEPQCNVVILGKPNVGKSSLMNLLVGEERSIVADMPGTTREAVSERIRFYKEDILLIDTAGVRKKRSVEEPLEELMVKSSFGAVDDADVVLLVVDGSQGRMTDQELKLAFYVFEQKYKSLIILFNKADLMDDRARELRDHFMELYQHLFKKVIWMDISCKDEKNIGRVMPYVHKVWQRCIQKFNEIELTHLFQEALTKRPLYKCEHMLRVKSAFQVKSSPLTVALTVNLPLWFEKSHCAYLEGVMRKQFDLLGVPIQFTVRKKRR